MKNSIFGATKRNFASICLFLAPILGFFGPGYHLHIQPIRDLPNKNAPADLDKVLATCLENLDKMPVIAPTAIRYPGSPEDPSYEEGAVPGMSEGSGPPSKGSVKVSRKRRGSNA